MTRDMTVCNINSMRWEAVNIYHITLRDAVKAHIQIIEIKIEDRYR